MDYKKASQVRKKGLISLIAEKKFQQGQGLGSSIGSAISEKFKAKSVGIKEKLDPLRMVSALTGKGTFGKVATTIAGRAFGRSEDTIEYFGGYGRKRKPKIRKDALHSSIGPGASTSLKVGDSEANILAKMYNFMEKTHEVQKKTYEIELAFREEEKAEDERRHKKLIDSILGRKTSSQPDKQKEDSSWIDDFVDKIKKTLGFLIAPILSVVGNLASWSKKFNEKLVDIIVKTIMSIFSTPSRILRMIGMGIVRSLPGPISAFLLGLLAVKEYKDLQGTRGKSDEASYQATSLNKGPSVKKGVFTPGLENNILEEYAEDYLNGKLGYYDSIVIPETGGKTAPFLLTDDEKNSLQKNFESLAKNYEILRKYQNNELGIDPKDFDIDGLKQSIADQLLSISNIQKQGSMRFKPAAQSKFGFSYVDALNSIEDNITKYGKSTAKEEVGKGYLDRKIYDFTEEIKSHLKLPELPQLDLNNFKIPDMLPDDFPVTDGEWNNADNVVSFNNTNNIGGSKPQTFNTASVKVRNDDLRRHNYQLSVSV